MRGQEGKIHDEINITPLTDIFLVLLIIMMVVAPLIVQRQLIVSVGVAEDTGTTVESNADPRAVSLQIDATGAYSIDGEPVLRANLVETIRAKCNARPEGVILVTSPVAPFESMAHAMDAAEAAGTKRVTVVDESADHDLAK